MLSIERVTHAYGVRDVSLSVERGQVVGVLGPNGAGKSTLSHIALGLLTPLSGQVSVDGEPLLELPVPERARRLSAVLQGEAAAFAFTARDLVALGLRRPRFGPLTTADKDAIFAALRRADALPFADRPLQTLSGGERQRVYVARALAQDTPYLVLDEPTTFFDIAHTLRFAALVGSLDKGVLWVLHDPALALRYCDKVLLMLQGSVVAEGPPREVLTEARMRAVFDVRVEFVGEHMVFR